jgi:hypothetical protein
VKAYVSAANPQFFGSFGFFCPKNQKLSFVQKN